MWQQMHVCPCLHKASGHAHEVTMSEERESPGTWCVCSLVGKVGWLCRGRVAAQLGGSTV